MSELLITKNKKLVESVFRLIKFDLGVRAPLTLVICELGPTLGGSRHRRSHVTFTVTLAPLLGAFTI